MLSGGLVDGRHRRLPTHPQHSLSLPGSGLYQGGCYRDPTEAPLWGRVKRWLAVDPSMALPNPRGLAVDRSQ
jgi:hypothetical protein